MDLKAYNYSTLGARKTLSSFQCAGWHKDSVIPKNRACS
jgi:hypothetical protein